MIDFDEAFKKANRKAKEYEKHRQVMNLPEESEISKHEWYRREFIRQEDQRLYFEHGFWRGAHWSQSVLKEAYEALINQKNRNIDALAEINNGMLKECPDCDYECLACHRVCSEIDEQQLKLVETINSIETLLGCGKALKKDR